METNSSLTFFHPAKFIGTWFGVGLSPKAPGTMGSIAALPFAYIIQTQAGNMALFTASVIAFCVGCWATHVYLPYTNAKDPREMVIDEVSGQWLLLSAMHPTLLCYLVGLVLFRFFDILKPWPINIADQKIHGGFGVMFDDTLAAIYPIFIVWCAVSLSQSIGYHFHATLLFWFM